MDAAYCEESGRYFLIAYSSYWVAKYELHPNGLIYLGHDYVDHGNAVLSPAAFYTQRSVKGEAECYCNGNELRVAITYSTLYGVGLPNEPAASLTYASLLHALSFDASDPVLSLNWEQNHVAGSIINDPINYPVDQSGNKIRWIGIGGLEFIEDGRYVYWFKQRFDPTGGPDITGYLGYLDWADGTMHQLMQIDMPMALDSRMERGVGSDGQGTSLYVVCTNANGEHHLGELADPDQPALVSWNPVAHPHTAISLSLDNSLEETFQGFPPIDRYAMITNTAGVPVAEADNLSLQCCQAVHDASAYHGYRAAVGNSTWAANSNPFMDRPVVRISGSFTIPQGAHVVASDMEFLFAEDAVFIIEPGASFVCNVCVLSNGCDDDRWKGIELQSTYNQHQGGSPYPTYQGYLSLNNSTVRNAEIGVLLAHRNALGNPVKTKEGGVINCLNGTRFENCRQGVFFRPYQNFDPATGQRLRNRSRFRNTTFTVDANYPEKETAYDFMHHAKLWRVDGIQFTACSFLNELPDAFFDANGNYPGSLYLGHGIYSLDADFRVQAQCTANPVPGPGQPCPAGQHLPTRFQGLDHGIHALTGTSLRSFSVDRAQFTDNIAGVFTEGVIGYRVENSLFQLGGRAVVLSNEIEEAWDLHRRGIYSYTCHAFIPDHNHFMRSGPASAEGVVIGYSRDHNDMVLGNAAMNIDNAYVGEGTCLSLDPMGPNIGLQFLCNENNGNRQNLVIRVASSSPSQEWADHGVRPYQGDVSRKAGNTFDRELLQLDDSDILNNTDRAVQYFFEGAETSFEPVDISVERVFPVEVGNGLADPCASRLIGISEPNNPSSMIMLNEYLQQQKMSYGNSRYLYEQLIDGGNTDAVVQEIISAWPQGMWDLRSYLLSKSPFLSAQSLKELVLKPSVPDAIKTEVLIANPEAVRLNGMVDWILRDGLLPEYMVGQIVASWDQQTYRFTLEGDMGRFHSEMSQAANILLAYHAADSTYGHLDSLVAVWQEVRTPAARLSEALGHMEEGQFVAANTVVQAIPQEHVRLPSAYLDEKNRMLAFISFVQGVLTNDRDLSELNSAEVAQLVTLVDGKHDRPSVWAQNILCFHYGICRAPYTGGSGEAPKRLPHAPSSVEEVVLPVLGIQPNPATTYVVVNYDLKAVADNSRLIVRDLGGREVMQLQLGSSEGQVVMTSRKMSAGVYTVELLNAGNRLLTEKLVVQP